VLVVVAAARMADPLGVGETRAGAEGAGRAGGDGDEAAAAAASKKPGV